MKYFQQPIRKWSGLRIFPNRETYMLPLWLSHLGYIFRFSFRVHLTFTNVVRNNLISRTRTWYYVLCTYWTNMIISCNWLFCSLPQLCPRILMYVTQSFFSLPNTKNGPSRRFVVFLTFRIEIKLLTYEVISQTRSPWTEPFS